MDLLYGSIFILYGLIIGSFLNVCVYRLPRDLPIARGRSMCTRCGRTLAWYDMVPLFSYLCLRGRCRQCGAPISLRYPLVEGATGLLFGAIYAVHGLTARSVIYCLAASVLLVAALIDGDTGWIPDRLSLLLALLGAASFLLPDRLPWWEQLLGAAVISLPMLGLALWRDGFGGGDIKLVAAGGLLLGYKLMLLAALAACLAGAVYGVFLLARRGAGRRTAFPFGPFLTGGMLLAMLAGDPLIAAYLSLFAL